jgi:sugar transferase (PEP-CTERM system associated)
VIRVLNIYIPARTLLLGMSEVVLVCLAFMLAVVLRLGKDARPILTGENGLLKIALMAGIYLLCMYYLDLYDPRIVSSRHQVLTRLLQVVGVGTVILSLIYYAYPGAQLGKGTFLLGLVLLFPALIVWRELFLHLVNSAHLSEKMVIVGHGPMAQAVSDEVQRRPETGLDVIGWVDVSKNGFAMKGLPYIGELSALQELVERHKVSRIVVAMEDRRGQLPMDDLLALKLQGAIVQDGADIYESVTGKVPVASLRPGWLLFTPGFQRPRKLYWYKQLVSFTVSLIALIVGLPLFIIIAIAVKLDSKGSVIFRQGRIGKNGKLFNLFKFRTMIDNADGDGKARPATDDDERFTRVGRWIRRTRLDEIPQLYNILRGDMHFVGPRPFVRDQEEECVRQIPFYRQRWAVKPGVTGWAQINRGYCATLEDNIDKAAYDIYYIKHMSVGLDLLILFQTVKTVLLGRGSR